MKFYNSNTVTDQLLVVAFNNIHYEPVIKLSIDCPKLSIVYDEDICPSTDNRISVYKYCRFVPNFTAIKCVNMEIDFASSNMEGRYGNTMLYSHCMYEYMPVTIETLTICNAHEYNTVNLFDYTYPNLKILRINNCTRIKNFVKNFPLGVKELYVKKCDWIKYDDVIELDLKGVCMHWILTVNIED